MGNYPESNPNSGVLGIYHGEEEVPTISEDLLYKEDWAEEDYIRAENYTEKWPSFTNNIAFHVVSENRLRRMIQDLIFKP
jgi:hypothetical protein